MAPRTLKLAPAAQGLLWQDWGDHYSVYQPSSSETHVFNDTTALILETLRLGPASLEEIEKSVAEALGVGKAELRGFSGVVGRLEELGLVEWLDEIPASP
jgi:PqqD family protein of HPr-rel-A system